MSVDLNDCSLDQGANATCRTLQIHAADNVSVVVGRPLGDIPVGHKVALRAIRAGDPIIKYGDPIGLATQDIAAGEWVHTHNLHTDLATERHFEYHPTDRVLALQQAQAARTVGMAQAANSPDPVNTVHPSEPRHASQPALSFSGYRRADGRVGIRNELWIIPTVGCVNKTAEQLADLARQSIGTAWPDLDGVFCYTHPYGCSQLGDDHETTKKILADLVRHPNAGGVLVLGLGCENNQIDAFKKELGAFDEKRVAFLVAQQVQDEIAVGLELLHQLAETAGQDRRVTCPLTSLVVGLKCGGSDAFSGMTANPLLGRFSDWLTEQGGSSVLTEIPEIFGAEHLLLNRCASEPLFTELSDVIQDFRDYYTAHGQPVYENPSPGNKAGGITTLEDKSIGCTQKAGSAVIMDVLRYGGVVRRQGLSVLEGPGNDMVAVTALAAAGCQIVLFTTGRGTPLGGPVPTVKIASNSVLAVNKPHWIDLDAGSALQGPQAQAELDQALQQLVLATANGQLARNEKQGYREIAIFKNGVTL